MEVEPTPPSGSDGVQNGVSVGLSIDLQSRCSAFLSDLGLDPSQPSGSTLVPTIIHDHASHKSNASDSVLFDALSSLLPSEAAMEHVARNFEPILLDLCARWLDSGELAAKEWERRLSALASISLLRPDIWK